MDHSEDSDGPPASNRNSRAAHASWQNSSLIGSDGVLLRQPVGADAASSPPAVLPPFYSYYPFASASTEPGNTQQYSWRPVTMDSISSGLRRDIEEEQAAADSRRRRERSEADLDRRARLLDERELALSRQEALLRGRSLSRSRSPLQRPSPRASRAGSPPLQFRDQGQADPQLYAHSTGGTPAPRTPPLPSPPRDQARAAAAAVAALERGRRRDRDRGRHFGRFRAPSPGRNRSPDSRLHSPERIGLGQPAFFPPHPHMWSYGPQPFPVPPGVVLPSSSRSAAASSSTPIEHPLKARYIGSDVTGHAAFGSVKNKLNGEFPHLFYSFLSTFDFY